MNKSKNTETKSDVIRQYLIKNPDKISKEYTETAKLFDVTYETIRHMCRNLRKEVSISKKEVKFVITEEVIRRKENSIIKSIKNQLEQAVKDYQQLSDAYDIALNLKSSEGEALVPVIDFNEKYNKEATAIIQISDGHFGKIIVPSTVNGLNSYNPDIAKKRMETCAKNAMSLIKKERADVKIENLILILGGDFLENSQLHHHSEMTTALSPMEETLFSRDLLKKFINTVCEYGNFNKIVVACTRGNHSRITHKMISSVDYRMNYEYILYNILKSDFESEDMQWTIPDSEVAEVDVYGNMIRIIHGHQVKYQGGVGGLTVPLNKYIMRMDQINKAYYNFVHHYHNLSYPTNNTTVNGSIIGYDPYAMSIGCSYQPPVQSFQLFDSAKGVTIKAPIHCD